MTFQQLPVKKIPLAELPSYWRVGSKFPRGMAYIECGQVRKGGNEPYCYTEEKQCAGHICRVLTPEKVYENAVVIRDDGTVWKLWLPAFLELSRLEGTE